MSSSVINLLIFANVVSYSSSLYSSKALEGYPSGYLSDCIVVEKDPVITPKTLKHLSIQVQGEEVNMKVKRKRYTYFHTKQLGKDPNLDYSKKTMMYIGGFLDGPAFPFAGSIALLYKRLGYNVMLLDTNYFTTQQYPLAALYMRTVGRHAAEMLSNLTRRGLDPKKVELVGLSLGAQTASFVAKNYRQLTGMNISRITALEPAGPCFRNLGPQDRLDQSDADFVDIVNTNIDGYGMAAPVGHVNVYVNGGEFQPGDFIWMPCGGICSHIRSYTIWMAALQNPNMFIAMQCDSVQEARFKNCYDKVPQITNVVGLNTDRRKEGIFYLATGNNFPYFLGEKGLKRDHEFFSSLIKNIQDSSDMKM